MSLENHKHCKNCGQIIKPAWEDKSILDKENFKREVAYGNCFCEQCIEIFGLIDLCRYYERIEMRKKDE